MEHKNQPSQVRDNLLKRCCKNIKVWGRSSENPPVCSFKAKFHLPFVTTLKQMRGANSGAVLSVTFSLKPLNKIRPNMLQMHWGKTSSELRRNKYKNNVNAVPYLNTCFYDSFKAAKTHLSNGSNDGSSVELPQGNAPHSFSNKTIHTTKTTTWT
jgi:hypothetical protein